MAYELSDLVNRAAFMSTEAQIVLEDLVAELPWQVKLGSENPTLTWGEGDAAIVTTPSLLGSVSMQAMTWRWAWDNINGFPAVVVRRAEEVKALADSTPVLTELEFPIETDSTLPLELTLAAKVLTGVWTHYAASAGPGTDVWFLLESPKLALGEPSVVRIGRVIAQGLSTINVNDHRTALLEYAKLRGLSYREDEDTLTLAAPDGEATVIFSAGHIANVKMAKHGAQAQAGSESAGSESVTTAAPIETDAPTEHRATEESAREEPRYSDTDGPKKKGLFSRLFGDR